MSIQGVKNPFQTKEGKPFTQHKWEASTNKGKTNLSHIRFSSFYLGLLQLLKNASCLLFDDAHQNPITSPLLLVCPHDDKLHHSILQWVPPGRCINAGQARGCLLLLKLPAVRAQILHNSKAKRTVMTHASVHQNLLNHNVIHHFSLGFFLPFNFAQRGRTRQTNLYNHAADHSSLPWPNFYATMDKHYEGSSLTIMNIS